MKKLLPAYILSFTISFMLYVIEPISMFSYNRNDFNFNLSNFIKPMILIFFVVFIGLSLFYTIIYFINKKFSNKLGFFNVVLIISFICFFVLYIHGNFLSSILPRLDGTSIDWSLYNTEKIISLLILLAITIPYIFCCIKFKFDKVINISKMITLYILVVLFIGFIPALCNSEIYTNRKVLFVSNKNINNISSNKNFLILLLDAVDSRTFYEAINDSEYKDLFNDFTYYPDTLSMYPFTRDSIPQILSGKVNHNEMDFTTYYNNAMDTSPLIDKLDELDYDINIYDIDLKWYTEKANLASNLGEYTDSFANICYAKNETKYILFRYLPFFLKQYSQIDYFNLHSCKVDYNSDAFSVDNIHYNNSVINNELEVSPENYFSFIHIDGAHTPFDLDENLNQIKDGTYMQKVKASLKITYNYLERLKQTGVYDNSVIIVMADHGFGDGNNWQYRTNPILFIKGINEHHDMIMSDKAISYDDLMDAYLDLLNDKKSTEIFNNISSERVRKFIWYLYLEEDHMEELVSAGKAWDFESMEKTGVEYNR